MSSKQMVTDSGGEVVQMSPAAAMMSLIERAATSSDVDVDKLEKLLNMKERWEAGEAKKSFDRAMTDFRARVGSIKKTRKAHNSQYAGLAESISAIKDLLTECGLSYSWRTNQESNSVSVTCVVSHVDGHSERTTLSASPDTSGSKNSIQAIGSTVSYLERYTLYAILGLASTDQDDDGHSAGTAYVTDDQLHNIIGLMDELGDKLDRDKFKGWLAKKGVDDFAKIPASMFSEVVGMLERKRQS